MNELLDTLCSVQPTGPEATTEALPQAVEEISQAVEELPVVEPEVIEPVLGELWGDFAGEAEELATQPHDIELTAVEAFGEQAQLVAGVREVAPFEEALTDHPIYQGILLLLAAAYVLMICAHLPSIIAYLGRSRSGEVRSGGPTRAIHTSAGIGLLLTATLLVRLCEGGLGDEYGTMTLLLTALLSLLGIALLQCGALALIGRVVLMRELTRGLITLKILTLGVGTLFLTPILLLMLLVPAGEGLVCSFLLLGVGFLVLLFFLKESFTLFLAKKVSIFHWFLYLCTVECLPISFVWLMALRW